MTPPSILSNLSYVLAAGILRSAIGLVGVAFIIMLVFSGYNYISAGGNKEALIKAQHSFTYAFIGLIIALSAWIIVSMVGRFVGVNFRVFSVCITPGCI